MLQQLQEAESKRTGVVPHTNQPKGGAKKGGPKGPSDPLTAMLASAEAERTKGDKPKAEKAEKGGKKGGKGGKGGKKEVDPAVAAKLRAKLEAKVEKEGGKKAQDIAGLRDMGGVSYFHVSVDSPVAEWDLMELCMKGMNTPCPEDADERRGGAEAIGKALMSYNDDKLCIYMHVPTNLPDCSIDEWFGAMCAGYKVIQLEGATSEFLRGEVKAEPENNVYPIKVRDDMINKGYQHLAAKQLVMPDDDDDDEMVFGDDDFYV